MASKAVHQDQDTASKLDLVLFALEEILRNQDTLRKSLEYRIDKLTSDLMADIDSKNRNLKKEMYIDLTKTTCRIDTLLKEFMNYSRASKLLRVNVPLHQMLALSVTH